MIKKYEYNGQTYYSDYEVRLAITEKENKAIYLPSTAEGWLEFNVKYTEEPTPLSELKELKLQEVSEKYLKYRNDTAVVKSSLGSVYDADRRAYLDVTGSALDLAEEETIAFRDAFDKLHNLNKTQLNTLAKEIRANTQKAYVVKWTYQQQIEQAKSEEDLKKINISFDIDPLLSTLSMHSEDLLVLPRI